LLGRRLHQAVGVVLKVEVVLAEVGR
jgi:hypothetical protein